MMKEQKLLMRSSTLHLVIKVTDSISCLIMRKTRENMVSPKEEEKALLPGMMKSCVECVRMLCYLLPLFDFKLHQEELRVIMNALLGLLQSAVRFPWASRPPHDLPDESDIVHEELLFDTIACLKTCSRSLQAAWEGLHGCGHMIYAALMS